MFVSAEIRWFWQGSNDMERWFRNVDIHGCAAGGGLQRDDYYLFDPKQPELGVKKRGSQPGVEVKGIVSSTFDTLSFDPFIGAVELWAKWPSTTLDIDSKLLVLTKKLRWLRKFDTESSSLPEIPLNGNEKPKDDRRLPILGCNAEVTRLEIDRATWWTFGLEAFGRIETLKRDLRAVALELRRRDPPPFRSAFQASYPRFLSLFRKDSSLPAL